MSQGEREEVSRKEGAAARERIKGPGVSGYSPVIGPDAAAKSLAFASSSGLRCFPILSLSLSLSLRRVFAKKATPLDLLEPCPTRVANSCQEGC